MRIGINSFWKNTSFFSSHAVAISSFTIFCGSLPIFPTSSTYSSLDHDDVIDSIPIKRLGFSQRRPHDFFLPLTKSLSSFSSSLHILICHRHFPTATFSPPVLKIPALKKWARKTSQERLRDRKCLWSEMRDLSGSDRVLFWRGGRRRKMEDYQGGCALGDWEQLALESVGGIRAKQLIPPIHSRVCLYLRALAHLSTHP